MAQLRAGAGAGGALRLPTGDELLIWGVVALSWALALVAPLAGADTLLRHDALLERGTLPPPLGLLLFLLAWQVMTGAMMLPSSLPMARLFVRVSDGQPRHRLAVGLFLAAYAVVWTGFALVALAADAGLHWLAAAWPALRDRPWLIAGLVLLLAGAFQFSPLKEQCLRECRHPSGFLLRHYGRGLRRAWALGLRHGLFCLGCCWALMLVMFAVGVGSLAWMAALTGVMLLEKTWRHGRRLVPIVGGALLLWGALALLQIVRP